MILEFLWGVLILGFAAVYALPIILGGISKAVPSWSAKFPVYSSPASLGAGITSIFVTGVVLALVIFAIRHVAPAESQDA
jgi:hypothetical protein